MVAHRSPRAAPRVLLASAVLIPVLVASCQDRPPGDPGASQAPAAAQPRFRTVGFPSADGLEVTADLYPGHSPGAPVVVLLHQSASSRGEYREIAPRLQALGYSALAVDLRWGGAQAAAARGISNETAARNGTDTIAAAVEAGGASPWPTIDASYADAVAALEWLRTERMEGPLWVVGSSFSTVLAVRLAAEGQVAGVIAFSPGEYDARDPERVREYVTAARVPILTVAGPDEAELAAPVAGAVTSEGSRSITASGGRHGASILDEDPGVHAELIMFLGHHTGGPPNAERVRMEAPGRAPVVVHRWDGPGEDRVVALFHQGGGSVQGEYGFLVGRLLEMGWDVVAADLPGGGDRFGFPNLTLAATPEPEGFRYCDALEDVRGVLALARAWRPSARFVAWGSSYSAALVLHAVADDSTGVERVLAFSPAGGEPMGECGVDAVVGRVPVPALILRPEAEAAIPAVARRLDVLRAAGQHVFVAVPGTHGSSALAPLRVEGDTRATWEVVQAFLTDDGPDPGAR